MALWSLQRLLHCVLNGQLHPFAGTVVALCITLSVGCMIPFIKQQHAGSGAVLDGADASNEPAGLVMPFHMSNISSLTTADLFKSFGSISSSEARIMAQLHQMAYCRCAGLLRLHAQNSCRRAHRGHDWRHWHAGPLLMVYAVHKALESVHSNGFDFHAGNIYKRVQC